MDRGQNDEQADACLSMEYGVLSVEMRYRVRLYLICGLKNQDANVSSCACSHLLDEKAGTD